MAKFIIDVPKEEYDKSGSKFITFSADDPVGKKYYHQIEMDMPDWDTPGVSLKFPVRITDGTDKDHEDKISCGVSVKAVWKLKEVLKALGVSVSSVKGQDGILHPVFDSNDVAGQKAVGCWEIQEGNKGGDLKAEKTKYPKLVSIYPSGYDPDFDLLKK